MRITYLKLINAAGIKAGQKKDEIEIHINGIHKIINIDGDNGKGKTVILSALHPYSYIKGDIDERSTLPFIIVGKDGYKEIHYVHGSDIYIIKHYFKATKETHTIKSYFSKNDNELNQNGNVTSFNSLIELHFGLTMDMMRLIRLGSNVKSIVELKSADRKNYIGNLMEEINIYLLKYRKVNDDIRLIKLLMQTNAASITKCQVADPLDEERSINHLKSDLANRSKQLRDIDIELDKIRAIVSSNNLYDLISKRNKIESDLQDLLSLEKEVLKRDLSNKTIDELNLQKAKLDESRITIQSEINALKMQIDNLLNENNTLEAKIRQSSITNNITALQSLVSDMERQLSNTHDSIRNFQRVCSSDDVLIITSKLNSFNDIGGIIYTFNKQSLEVYLKLVSDKADIGKFISNQVKLNLNRVSETELRKLLNRLFDDEIIITPNCDTEYTECPYYRFASLINENRAVLESEIYDEEVINQVKIISNNIDHIFNGLYELRPIKIPDGFREIMEINTVYSRLRQRLVLFDVSNLSTYLSMLKSHELYLDNFNKLQQYRRELQLMKDSGSFNFSIMLDENLAKIEEYRTKISALEESFRSISSEIISIGIDIDVLQRYQDGIKYKALLESNIKDVEKILIPLEKASEDERELMYQRKSIQIIYDGILHEINTIQNRVNDYNRLIEEASNLNDKFGKRSIVLESLSTKKGVPLKYMNIYLAKIKKFTNDLLKIIYNGSLYIHKFKVDPDSFEIPFYRDDMLVPDIRYASQSELALITMALSFALAYNSAEKYNILLLDEIDGGLDETNRSSFMKMLNRQMVELQSEQVFIISHNMNQMVNVPMDVIQMSAGKYINKLQNVIYESNESSLDDDSN